MKYGDGGVYLILSTIIDNIILTTSILKVKVYCNTIVSPLASKNMSINNRRKNKKSVLKIILHLFLFLAIAIFLYLVSGILASRHFEINTYKLDAAIDYPIRIVQLSDLHDREFGPNNIELVETVREQKPDFIVMTGDMVSFANPDLDIVTTLVRQLKDIAPVFYSLGNHEFAQVRAYNRDFVNPITNAGGTVLNINFIHMDVNGNDLCIGGCPFPYRDGNEITGNKDELAIIDQWCDEFEAETGFHILLNHMPASVLDNNGTDIYPVELYFSGDYHGGIFRIPLIDRGVFVRNDGLFPKYTKGVVQGKKGTLVLSAGLGNAHNIPRIFNPPEIVVVDLLPKES